MSVYIEHRYPDVPVIILNRPERRNSLSVDLMAELKRQLVECADSEKIRGVILEGKGKDFSTGLDLKDATSDEMVEKGAVLLRELFLLLATYPKPLITSIRGCAIAGGFGIAALGDLVIASKEAVFQLPEVHRGLVPAILLTTLKRRLPLSLLRSMSLFGLTLTAEEAHHQGIVHLLVDEKDRTSRLNDVVSHIRKGAPGAQFHTKTLLDRLEGIHISEELFFAEGLYRKARDSDEAREGIASFFEKRNPSWMQHK
jgi:enoyl-CoA hydratase/carnithine racemase